MPNEFMQTASGIIDTGSNGIDYLHHTASKHLTPFPIPVLNNEKSAISVYYDEKTRFAAVFNITPQGAGYTFYDFDRSYVLDNYWYANPSEEKQNSASSELATLTPENAKLMRLSYGFDWAPASLFLETLATLRKNKIPLERVVKNILKKEEKYLTQIERAPDYEPGLDLTGYLLNDEEKGREMFIRTVTYLQENDTVATTSLIMVDMKTNHYLNFNHAHCVKSMQDHEHVAKLLQKWDMAVPT